MATVTAGAGSVWMELSWLWPTDGSRTGSLGSTYKTTTELTFDYGNGNKLVYHGLFDGTLQQVMTPLSQIDIHIGGALSFSVSDIAYSWANWGIYQEAGAMPFNLAGDDTITGSTSFSNYLIGYAGNDIVIGGDATDTLEGGDGNDTLVGGAGADSIHGGAGDDWIEGETGNDPFSGIAGGDAIDGGSGNDIVLGGDGNDFIFGGAGVDALVGEAGDDLIYGGTEQDLIDGRTGRDFIWGEDGADIIFGDAGADSIDGGDGDDLIMGERGENTAIGDNDTLVGGNGNDMLDGSAGDDYIMGGSGNDIVDGDVGNDTIIGGEGAEIIAGSDYNGVSGRDTFLYQSIGDAGDWIYGFRAVVGDSDKIDVSQIFALAGYAGSNPRADGYLMIQQSGGNTQILVDANGPSGGANWVNLLTLSQVTLDPANLDSYFVYH